MARGREPRYPPRLPPATAGRLRPGFRLGFQRGASSAERERYPLACKPYGLEAGSERRIRPLANKLSVILSGGGSASMNGSFQQVLRKFRDEVSKKIKNLPCEEILDSDASLRDAQFANEG